MLSCISVFNFVCISYFPLSLIKDSFFFCCIFTLVVELYLDTGRLQLNWNHQSFNDCLCILKHHQRQIMGRILELHWSSMLSHLVAFVIPPLSYFLCSQITDMNYLHCMNLWQLTRLLFSFCPDSLMKNTLIDQFLLYLVLDYLSSYQRAFY